MLLIINICKEKLHYYEFVKPIEDILRDKKIKFETKHYKKLIENNIKKSDKIIICGTSLKDNEFLENLDKFQWIKNFNRQILGICGGMQIISLIFGGKLKQKQEIGFYEENFNDEFLGLNGKKEVYHLHNNYATLPADFKKFNKSKIPQAVKHKTKQIYGVLFHPEVRNKRIIEKFADLM